MVMVLNGNYLVMVAGRKSCLYNILLTGRTGFLEKGLHTLRICVIKEKQPVSYCKDQTNFITATFEK